MKKLRNEIKKKTGAGSPSSRVEEVQPGYGRSVKSIPVLKDFNFTEFKKIADKAPFTQSEWAAMLHLSERTLQRYAKSDGVFAPMNAERVLQIARVLEQGKITFGKVENFYNWLKREPNMLEGNLSMNDLSTYDGIQKILTQLGRIQHGILA
jgi:putative toxin-antitoxin system antitoxin component (TIGR02293 family)